MEKIRRILVTAAQITHVDRQLLEGILAYAREKKGVRWQVDLDFGEIDCCPIPIDLSVYDGFITLVTHPDQRDAARRRTKPTVLVEDVLCPGTIPTKRNIVTIVNDHTAEGAAAADYFLARHFRNFAWYGEKNEPDWSAARHRGFADRLRSAGFSCTVFTGTGAELPRWLAGLPKPCAVFAPYDLKARRIVDTAVRSGIDVPRDLSVLGVDDDELVCTTSYPTLSSIPSIHPIIGQAAGRILNELMSGHARGGRVIRTRHTRVVSRLSTNVDALSDGPVAQALTYIRNHLYAKLDIASLARHAGCPKYKLQASAMRAFGHPFADEIRKIRLAAAKELLTETDTPITEIAESCGYTSMSHLAMRIREDTGLTPLAFRRRYRPLSTDSR